MAELSIVFHCICIRIKIENKQLVRLCRVIKKKKKRNFFKSSISAKNSLCAHSKMHVNLILFAFLVDAEAERQSNENQIFFFEYKLFVCRVYFAKSIIQCERIILVCSENTFKHIYTFQTISWLKRNSINSKNKK